MGFRVPRSGSAPVFWGMTRIALQMLFGARGRYGALIFGLAFAVLLSTQQSRDFARSSRAALHEVAPDDQVWPTSGSSLEGCDLVRISARDALTCQLAPRSDLSVAFDGLSR